VQKILGRVKIDKTLAKWGNTDEKILNRVIRFKNIKLEGKNWNLLKNKYHKHQTTAY
jgi:hypothetical protein